MAAAALSLLFNTDGYQINSQVYRVCVIVYLGFIYSEFSPNTTTTTNNNNNNCNYPPLFFSCVINIIIIVVAVFWLPVLIFITVFLHSLRRADHSSRGVLPSVVRRCVWSRNLMNEVATARLGPQCPLPSPHPQKKSQHIVHAVQGYWLAPNDSKLLLFPST